MAFWPPAGSTRSHPSHPLNVGQVGDLKDNANFANSDVPSDSDPTELTFTQRQPQQPQAFSTRACGGKITSFRERERMRPSSPRVERAVAFPNPHLHPPDQSTSRPGLHLRSFSPPRRCETRVVYRRVGRVPVGDGVARLTRKECTSFVVVRFSTSLTSVGLTLIFRFT